MKIMDKIKMGILAIMLILVMQSCLKDDFNEVHEQLKENIPQTYGNFDFTTINEFDITLKAITANKEAISGAYIEIYAKNPLNIDGLLKNESDQEILFKGVTNVHGTLECSIAPKTNMDSIYILSYHAGIPPLQKAALDNDKVNINLVTGNENQSKASLKNADATPTVVNGYNVLGNWNSYGIPDYLEPANDIISSAFLDDVNASLPERTPLPESHPQYLANTTDATINIVDNCEIWVTLVHEGAGWHNTLGYYTYPTENPPNSIEELSDRTIIFPDVTINSNTLSSGNKVQLQYFDANNNEFTTVFPTGTSVGWFLIAQGWNSSQQTIGNGIYTHYSNVNINNEEDPSLQKHNVLLYDEARELLLLGFEDIRRDQLGCDQDFNDAIFYATMNPITAVDLSIYQPIDQPIDNDNDGVSDVFDQYPNNAQKAFDNYYPGNSTFGTLLFEDLWPFRGDYDFNDLVVDYQFNQTTNSQNQVTNISTKLVVKAIGASYHNGFGIEFNTSPTNVASVTGQELSKNIINLSGNGTENGQANAVVIMFDDAFNA
ncbi:MAG: LruC domain-containing protein, partial [Bacteroidales bacterium]|nr:LruC domain-containing protein [Bacteroidales bacterium]